MIESNNCIEEIDLKKEADDRFNHEMLKLASEYKEKDPIMANDLEKLSKSKLSQKSIKDFIDICNNNTSKIDKDRHFKKVLAKRRKANKNAKKMRKLNRKK